MYIRTHTHVNTHVHVDATRTHTHTHVHVTQVHINTYIHIYTFTRYKYTHTHARAGVVPTATGALMKQAVERIARIRDVAARRLHGLVSCPHVAAAMPAAAAVAAALPADDGTAEVVSLQVRMPLLLHT